MPEAVKEQADAATQNAALDTHADTQSPRTYPIWRSIQKHSEDIAYGSILQDGTYGIVNVDYDRDIGLGSGDIGSFVCAIQPIGIDANELKWIIKQESHGVYSAINVEHQLHAEPNVPMPALSDNKDDQYVVGKRVNHEENCRWTIRESNSLGKYTIMPPSSNLCWYLGSGITGSRVTLKQPHTATFPVGYLWNFVPLGDDTISLFKFPYNFICCAQEKSSMCFVERFLPSRFSLRKDFTLVAWLVREKSPDATCPISLESPQCGTSLLSLMLPAPGEAGVLQVIYATGHCDGDIQCIAGQTEIPPLGVWFHIALVCRTGRGGTTLFKMYVNGLGDTPHTSTDMIFHGKDTKIVLGRRRVAQTAQAQWSGTISQLQLFQAALTDAQIEKHIATATLPPILLQK